MWKNMNNYLFTWNPERWHWADLPEAVYRVNIGEEYFPYWSCGNTKKIKTGDRFFLMRLGLAPKGIIGTGQILSEPYELPHWDDEKAKKGQMALRVDLVFSSLSETPIIAEDALKTLPPLNNFNWFPQSSGISIPENIATNLLSLFEGALGFSVDQLTTENLGKIKEGKPKKVTVTSYDRSPVARQVCIETFGTTCVVCGFNFGEKYGEIGNGFIHVHHLNQIADSGGEYQIDPEKDLRPVCANCHAMLHKKRPAFSIDEIKKKIST